MSQQLKSISMIFLAVVILLFSSVNAFALIYGNETDGGFAGNGGGKSTAAPIRTYVIEGAGYFLGSYSDILAFLNKVELAELKGTDYTELQKTIDSAVANMQAAKESYYNLVQIADVTPYDTDVIEKLTAFDYSAFLQENRPNDAVFAEVEAYLGKGDIRGVYHRFLTVSEELLARLNTVKTEIDACRIPRSGDLWDLNESASLSLLFGQYTAEVFHRILEQ